MTCKHNRIGRVLTWASCSSHHVWHTNIVAWFGVPVPHIVWLPIAQTALLTSAQFLRASFSFQNCYKTGFFQFLTFTLLTSWYTICQTTTFVTFFYACYCNTLSNVNVRRRGTNPFTSCCCIGNHLFLVYGCKGMDYFSHTQIFEHTLTLKYYFYSTHII